METYFRFQVFFKTRQRNFLRFLTVDQFEIVNGEMEQEGGATVHSCSYSD